MGPSQSIAVGQSVGPASLGATSAGWAIPALGPTAAGGDLVVDWAYGPTLWTDLWPGLWTDLWTDLWPGPLDRPVDRPPGPVMWPVHLGRSCDCFPAGVRLLSAPRSKRAPNPLRALQHVESRCNFKGAVVRRPFQLKQPQARGCEE